MITHSLTPPRVDIYLISDNGIVEENGYTTNSETGEIKYSHPEFEKFEWTIDDNNSNRIYNLRNTLLQRTLDGKKSVIAIFQDKTIKTFENVEIEFVPTLNLKNK